MIIVLRHHWNIKNLYFLKLKTFRLPLIFFFLREKRIEIS